MKNTSKMHGFEIKKILVPLDFSDNSMDALHMAMSLAKKNCSTIRLLFVKNVSRPSRSSNPRRNVIKSLSVLSSLVNQDANITCSFSYLWGDISNCIMKESQNEKADLIVMGKNGDSKARQGIGGNTYNVIKSTSKLMLVVPPGKMWSELNNVLFLINKIYYYKDDEISQQILERAASRKNFFNVLAVALEKNTSSNAYSISQGADEIIRESDVPVFIIKQDKLSIQNLRLFEEFKEQGCN